MSVSTTKFQESFCWLRSDVHLDQLGPRLFSALPRSSESQHGEHQLREAVMKEHEARKVDEILRTVGNHHCLTVMRHRAANFRSEIGAKGHILDLGGGTGWYWRGTRGAQVVIVDFSLESLRVADRILSENDEVVLIHADARALPFCDGTFDGLWSVQVLQHFEDDLLRSVLCEVARVLGPTWCGELHSLHAPLLHRVVYTVCRRVYHRVGSQGEYFLRRISPKEWVRLLNATNVTFTDRPHCIGYSELFFHPNFRLIPTNYPLVVEQGIAKWRWLASLLARQGHIKYSAGR